MSTIDFSLGDLLDESAERAGLDPGALSHRHLNSITRSLQLLLTDVENRGATPEDRMQTVAVPLPQGYGAVQLPADTLDVTQASVFFQGKPYPLGRTSREDYQNLSFPTQLGNPSIFWLSKSQPPESVFLTNVVGGTYTPSLDFSDGRNTQNIFMFPAWPGGGQATAAGTGPYLVLWPQNNLGATQLTVTRLRQIGMPNAFGDQLDATRNWTETLCKGLAARIAEKYNPEAEPGLLQKYERALLERDAEQDHHPVIIAYRGHGWGRGRRH